MDTAHQPRGSHVTTNCPENPPKKIWDGVQKFWLRSVIVQTSGASICPHPRFNERGRRLEANHGIRRDTWCYKPTLGCLWPIKIPPPPPLVTIAGPWQNYWGLKDRFELKLLGGHSLNPLPSVHSLWLITKPPLVCWLDGIIGDWRTHEIPQLPTHLLWHPKSTVWYPWPIIGPPKKHWFLS